VVALSVASGLRLPRGCWALSALGSGSAGLQRARHAASASSPLGLAWTVAISKAGDLAPELPRSANRGWTACTAAGHSDGDGSPRLGSVESTRGELKVGRHVMLRSGMLVKPISRSSASLKL
jgi:hypothetical protein